MNPKSAYLALHGAIPRVWGAREDGCNRRWFRILLNNWQLCYYPYSKSWAIKEAVRGHLEITWEEIQDETLDLLEWSMIESFVSKS